METIPVCIFSVCLVSHLTFIKLTEHLHVYYTKIIYIYIYIILYGTYVFAFGG